MKKLRITAPWMTVVLALALVSCSRNQNAPEVPGSAGEGQSGRSAMNIPGFHGSRGLRVADRPGNVFNVQYSDNTSIVDLPTVARALKGVSADHSIFLFQDSPALRQKLVPGKCVLFEGLDLRKVDALAVDGSTLIVGTETAPLREALKSAKVQFQVPVDFQDVSTQLRAERMEMESAPTSMALLHSLVRAWDAFDPPVYADSGGELEGDSETSDDSDAKWKIHYKNVFNPDHSMTLDVKLHREDEGGLDAEINASANVSKFVLTDSLLTADGQFQAASYQNAGLHGTVNFDWTITTSESKTSMAQGRLKLPGSLKVPLQGETLLPMSLELSELLLFHPAFPTKGDVAKGAFSVKFGGDEGFKLTGSNLEATGESTGDGGINTTQAFSPLAAYGLVVAVAAPRVELKMGTEELFDMAKLPLGESSLSKSLEELEKMPIVGKWLNKKGNPLATEASAYFQVVISTTASHSGMLSLVPCQQFTMLAKGQVGVDAKLLGTSGDIQPKDVFTKSVTETQPNNKICGGAATGQPQ